MAPECGASTMRPAPEFDPGMAYVHGRSHRPIRDYETVDARFVWRTSTPNLPASPAAKTSPQR